ncbi:MAG: hypothetical protein QM783_13230 [Phycisphaerales bacterium]
MTDDRALWVKRLRAAAETTLGKAPAIPAPGTFRDERRNKLEVDEGLFAALRSTVWTAPASARGDVKLWGNAPVDAVVLPDTGGEGRPLLGDWTNQASDKPHVGMEEWGERELCGLHALWSRARAADEDQRVRWLRRGYSACRWLLENLQPDNATNMPWSAHVWVMASGPGVWGPGLGPEARVYAETLLHNCQVGGGLGRPDKRSAWVLFHAASELERW